MELTLKSDDLPLKNGVSFAIGGSPFFLLKTAILLQLEDNEGFHTKNDGFHTKNEGLEQQPSGRYDEATSGTGSGLG